MPRLSLSKSSLSRETRQLKSYRRFLPSLDMKRRQLIVEREKTLREMEQIQQAIDSLQQQIGRDIPMLANQDIAVEGLLRVDEVELDEENVMGTRLPLLQQVKFNQHHYALLGRPHWVDRMLERMREMLQLQLQLQVIEHRRHLLHQAVQKITQRVNLFDKVLIPRTEQNISRIRIYLADSERAGVVRAKIAKRKHARAVEVSA